MLKFIRYLALSAALLGGASIAGCAHEELYDTAPPHGYYEPYPAGWYDGWGYGFGVWDAGGFYGGHGWWDHDHHWHPHGWERGQGHIVRGGAGAAHSVSHSSGGSGGGHAGGSAGGHR